MAEEDTTQDKKLELAQKLFLLKSKETAESAKEQLKREVLEAIESDCKFLFSFCHQVSKGSFYDWPLCNIFISFHLACQGVFVNFIRKWKRSQWALELGNCASESFTEQIRGF